MDIKKNHRKHFNLECFDKISDNTFINEETGIWLKFYNNGFVQNKINYLIEDIVEERAPLRVHSYDENPSEVSYDIDGNVININYSDIGKLHSVGGQCLFNKKNGISYWMHGKRHDETVKRVFEYFDVPFNKIGAGKLLPFIKIFYKSPEKIDEFLDILNSLEIKVVDCDSEKVELLEISYF